MRIPRSLLFIGLAHICTLATLARAQNASQPEEEEVGSIVGGGGGLVLNNRPQIKPIDDPEYTLKIVESAQKNEISALIETNRTKAMISCETGEMLVRINFTEPFRGVGYADYDRSSPCNFVGEGATYYEMRLPLKGCGTKQEAPRLFINNIILRFHRSLELEEDEVKTIVCHYPPPLVATPPPPPGAPARIIDAPVSPAKLTQYEPFIIIAGLLFFALLLAGVGTTSYVTRKQVIKPVNTPLPITSTTEYDTYIDNQSIIDVDEIKSSRTIVPFPKLTTKLVDDVFITNLHEIETVEDLVHHTRVVPRPKVERIDYDDNYIRNYEENIEEEILRQQQLANMRRLERYECDDAYITNQDEIIEEDNLISHNMLALPPKIEIRTIEDTFITKVDEVVEKEDTTYLKNHETQEYREEHEEYRNYQSFD